MDDGTAKLCDLGLARRVEHGNTLTETNAVLGTPDYMAPEQARSRNLTSAIDIYALGITLYHALTGKVPLKEETTVATLMVRQKQTPPPLRKSLPGTPGWLNRLLVRMTHPVPGDRPTVAEVSKAVKLERFSIRISLKWVAVVILFSALITVLVIGYQSISHGDAVDYLVDGKSVQGLDSSGKVIWRATIPYSKVIYEKGDITGDGKPDIILYTKSGTLNIESHNNETLWVGAINSRGRFLTNMNLYPFLGSWEIPYEKQFKQTAFLLDLDDD